jgi:hypothetical protein
MNKYPLVIMFARKGGPVTHQDAIDLVVNDDLLESYFQHGREMPVMVANVLPAPTGWGFCYIIVYGDVQMTPCVHIRGSGFNGKGLGEPKDFMTFLEGFPEIGYEGEDDPDFKHTAVGIECQLMLTPEELAMVLSRFPSPEDGQHDPINVPINNRTLH